MMLVFFIIAGMDEINLCIDWATFGEDQTFWTTASKVALL